MKCGFDHAVKNPGKCTKNTYVLRKRGTDVPTIDPNTNEMIELVSEDGTETIHFEIPATSSIFLRSSSRMRNQCGT